MKVLGRYTNLLFILMFVFCPFVLGHEHWKQETPDEKLKEEGNNAGRETEFPEEDPVFDKIASLFLTGSFRNYFFNQESPATQALKAECSNEYTSLESMLENIATADIHRLGDNLNEGVLKAFKEEILKCGKILFKNYYTDIHEKPQTHPIFHLLFSFQKYSLGDNYYNENNLDRIKEFNRLLNQERQNKEGSFFYDCVMHTKNEISNLKGYRERRSSQKITSDPYNWNIFEFLWDKDNEGKRCYQRREEMKLLVDDLENRLKDTKEDCLKPKGTCIENLKQKVALLPSPPRNASAENKTIFFQACGESWIDNQHCCSSSLKECSLYDQVQGRYQQVLSQKPRAMFCKQPSTSRYATRPFV